MAHTLISDDALLDGLLRYAREATQTEIGSFARGMVAGRLLLVENLLYGYDEVRMQAVSNEVRYLLNKVPS